MTASQILDLPGRDALEELDVMRNLEHLVTVDRLKALARFVQEYATAPVDPEQTRLPGRERTRFLSMLDGVVADVDAEAVARREAEAATEQVAKATQTTAHGMRGFSVRAPFPVIARLDATVAHLADAVEALGHGGTLEERRVLAVLVLADPAQAVALLEAYHRANQTNQADPADRVSTGSTSGPDECVESCGNAPDGVTLDLAKLLPQVVLHVHLSEAAVRTGAGVARVEGLGFGSTPLTAAWVRSWLGPRARFVVKPVLVPEAQTPVDAYEVPAAHREAVHLMSPADCFPWVATTTRAVQIDHTGTRRVRASV